MPDDRMPPELPNALWKGQRQAVPPKPAPSSRGLALVAVTTVGVPGALLLATLWYYH